MGSLAFDSPSVGPPLLDDPQMESLLDIYFQLDTSSTPADGLGSKATASTSLGPGHGRPRVSSFDTDNVPGLGHHAANMPVPAAGTGVGWSASGGAASQARQHGTGAGASGGYGSGHHLDPFAHSSYGLPAMQHRAHAIPDPFDFGQDLDFGMGLMMGGGGGMMGHAGMAGGMVGGGGFPMQRVQPVQHHQRQQAGARTHGFSYEPHAPAHQQSSYYGPPDTSSSSSTMLMPMPSSGRRSTRTSAAQAAAAVNAPLMAPELPAQVPLYGSTPAFVSAASLPSAPAAVSAAHDDGYDGMGDGADQASNDDGAYTDTERNHLQAGDQPQSAARRSTTATRGRGASRSSRQIDDSASVGNPVENVTPASSVRTGRSSASTAAVAAVASRVAAVTAPSSASNESSAPAGKNKKRFLWTEDLHRRFVSAIFDFGLSNATPKTLHSLMQPADSAMTSDHIKSHLQKFRNNSKSGRDMFLKDFERARREADARAADQLKRTGTAPLPVHFSVYPMSMPPAKQADGGAAVASAATEEDLEPPCHRCEQYASLFELGVGLPDDEHIGQLVESVTSLIKATGSSRGGGSGGDQGASYSDGGNRVEQTSPVTSPVEQQTRGDASASGARMHLPRGADGLPAAITSSIGHGMTAGSSVPMASATAAGLLTVGTPSPTMAGAAAAAAAGPAAQAAVNLRLQQARLQAQQMQLQQLIMAHQASALMQQRVLLQAQMHAQAEAVASQLMGPAAPYGAAGTLADRRRGPAAHSQQQQQSPYVQNESAMSDDEDEDEGDAGEQARDSTLRKEVSYADLLLRLTDRRPTASARRSSDPGASASASNADRDGVDGAAAAESGGTERDAALAQMSRQMSTQLRMHKAMLHRADAQLSFYGAAASAHGGAAAVIKPGGTTARSAVAAELMEFAEAAAGDDGDESKAGDDVGSHSSVGDDATPADLMASLASSGAVAALFKRKFAVMDVVDSQVSSIVDGKQLHGVVLDVLGPADPSASVDPAELFAFLKITSAAATTA